MGKKGAGLEGEEKGEGGKGKNEPACPKKEQAGGVCWLAGVAKGDRKIRRDQTATLIRGGRPSMGDAKAMPTGKSGETGPLTLIREIDHAWSMLFELNARQGVGLVAAEDEDLAVMEEFGSLTPTLP